MFLLYVGGAMKSESVSQSVMSYSLQLHGLRSMRLLCPWNFLGKNTEVGCHFLLQDTHTHTHTHIYI